MQLQTKKILQAVTGLTASGILLAGSVAFAQSAATPTQNDSGVQRGWGRGMGMRPGVFGTVASVSGNSITITSTGRPMMQGSTTPTTFTIDAANASIEKNNVTSNIGAIAVGDTIMVQGTVTGTNVVATRIFDGIPQRGPRMGFGAASSTGLASIIKGNGQPVIGGNVTAISGNTITVTTAQGPGYSVDVTNATIEKQGSTASISSILTGDRVVVQGAVNGSSVTASSVLDSGSAQSVGQLGTSHQGGFFGAIGGFFHRLFGFF